MNYAFNYVFVMDNHFFFIHVFSIIIKMQKSYLMNVLKTLVLLSVYQTKIVYTH